MNVESARLSYFLFFCCQFNGMGSDMSGRGHGMAWHGAFDECFIEGRRHPRMAGWMDGWIGWLAGLGKTLVSGPEPGSGSG